MKLCHVAHFWSKGKRGGKGREVISLVASIVKAIKWENVYLEMGLGLDNNICHISLTTITLSRKYK